MQPVVGQRWVSTAEPELGIGKVVSADARNVSLRFDRVGETRTFRFANAPLARYALKPGDSANFPSGRAIVKDAGEREGLLWYDTTLGLFRESDVVDAQASGEGSLSARLLDGERCSVEDFELRVQANELRAKIGSDPARGFVGPRIDLYPHQLQIAANACSEARLPRRLLSDEVGLGKTIEAGLIFHRLLRTGRIRRALVVVPQALRHQWMVEMYRRFNVAFTLVDDEYCAQLDATLDRSDDDRDFRRKSGTEALRSDIGEGKVAKNSANPFARSDFQIVDQDWLVVPGRREQLMAVRFDLVIVDEAHTISPAPEHRALYELLKELARKTPGLLLLTATPVQLRLDAHFARLHLLDAARYPDFEKWKEEHERYTEIARALSGLVERMDDPEAPWASTVATLKKRTALRKIAETVPDPENVTCSEALRFLCDSLGTGRAVVRNTRRSVGGFFKRKLVRHELKADPAYRAECVSMADEIGLEPEEQFWFGQNGAVFFDKRWFEDARQKRVEELWTRDEKIRWLASFLKKRPKEKVLVLCGSEFSALSTQCALRRLGVPDVAIFFEQMGESYLDDGTAPRPAARRDVVLDASVLDEDGNFVGDADDAGAKEAKSAEERRVRLDSAAAAFADPDGPSVLVSSEIGSEGRNFQCAHHLVLFDLPDGPGKLEQRIGRVDRVGQTHDVSIHVPYAKGTLGERLCDWYDLGLDVFVRPAMGIENVHSAHLAELKRFLDAPSEGGEEFARFLPAVRAEVDRLRDAAESGRDLLLEFNSFDPREAEKLVRQVRECEEENAAEGFVLEAMERFGAEISRGKVEGTWVLRPGENLPEEGIAGLPAEGITFSSDRAVALRRENVSFFSIDHPIVQSALDLALADRFGRVCFAVAKSPFPKGIHCDFHFVVEAAPRPDWNLQECVWPVHEELVLDLKGRRTPGLEETLSFAPLSEGSPAVFARVADELSGRVEALERSAHDLALERAREELERMRESAARKLDGEIRRLERLRSGNETAIGRRLEQLVARRDALDEVFRAPQVRLDALRVVLGA